MKVSFFGHRDTPFTMNKQEQLEKEIEALIWEGADDFYVGNQGNFDAFVFRALRRLKKKYEHIRLTVVLAYMPEKKRETDYWWEENTLYPEGLERVPRRAAIIKRNEWMVERADTVFAHIVRGGGAAVAVQKAERKEKRVLYFGKGEYKITEKDE